MKPDGLPAVSDGFAQAGEAVLYLWGLAFAAQDTHPLKRRPFTHQATTQFVAFILFAAPAITSMAQSSPRAGALLKQTDEGFASVQITGLRQSRDGRNKVMVADPNAPPLWARFYEIETGRPLFSGRDGVPKYRLSEIEAERRNGYAWYGSWGEPVAAHYVKWSKKWLESDSNLP